MDRNREPGADPSGMADRETSKHRWLLQATVIGLLVIAYVAAAICFRVVLGTDIVYTHIAYIPIVLAGIWWGRKSVLLAAFLGLVTLAWHVFGLASGAVWADIARVLLFVGVAFCVGTLSEQVRAGQGALRVSEEDHQLILDKSLAGVFLYRDDRFVFMNPRFAEIIRYAPKELIGGVIWDVFPDDEQARVKELVLRRKEEGFSDLHYECRIIRKDGEEIWVDVASSAANYEGKPSVLVNVYDITDRKEAEEKRVELSELTRKQEEQLVHSTRLAELGEMAAAIAHELNQPLTGIRNFAKNAFYMIEHEAGSPGEVKENLSLISEQVDRAARIINQMRELTRRSDREFALVNINNILQESVEFLMPQFNLSGVEVALNLAEDLPKTMGDGVRLEQVFLNLLTNARQAMTETEDRHLKVTSRFEAGHARPVVVEITDTGKGFASEEAGRLFQPFFTTKKSGHGTGLGLSISLSIIEGHKGEIEATGEPGKGATFTVRLPILRGKTVPETSAENEQN